MQKEYVYELLLARERKTTRKDCLHELRFERERGVNYNTKLSLNRANNAKSQLMKGGVSGSRIKVEGKGFPSPYDNKDLSNNKRVDISPEPKK